MRIIKLLSVVLIVSQFAGFNPLMAKAKTTPLCTPTISLSVQSRTICTGSAAVFSTTITNGGSSPTYQWIRNGSIVGTNTPTLTTVFVNNGDVFACVLISNDPCASPTNSVISNAITMVVSASLTPNIVISTPSNTICGSSAVFTSTVTHGGVVPAYQWKKNGTNVGSNIPTYSPTSLVNGDVIYCQLTSTLSCATPSAVNSNSITMTASASVVPTILISTPTNTICGTSAVFTSTITNGGSTPAYQWKKNGTNVGSNIPTYSPTTLVNGDVVYCQLTSNLACASPTAVTSNSVTITVSSSVTPTILISTASNTICGSSAVFTSTITNGGTPAYQWKKNGANVGSNIPTYSPTSLVNGDVIFCQLTSNLSCASPTAVSSNSITMTISTTVAPTILISTPNNTICGASAVFTSSITNGGSTPTYQWKKNGANVGSNIPTYSPTTLVNGDIIYCQLTSNLACASPTAVNSNSITMAVSSSSVTPTILISTPSNTICGSVAAYTATATNGGPSPFYQWMKNGSNVGTNSDMYSATTLISGDVIQCYFTSSSPCASPVSVMSNTIGMVVLTCTGIENLSDEKAISVYPNPANGVLNIEIATGKNYSVKLMDELGRVLLSEDNTKAIDTGKLTNGIYYLNVTSEGNTSVKKVVISH